MGTGKEVGRPCSAARALRIVGEKWALLAVREIAFGNHRFDDIARNTGASRDILTTRLRTLEEAGVLVRRRYQDRPARHEYHLTEAGDDLRPILNLLRSWGDKWVSETPPARFEHACGHPLDAVSVCAHCRAEIRPGDLRMHVETPGWTRTGPVRD